MLYLRRHKKEIIAIVVAVLALFGVNLVADDILALFE